MNNLGQYLTEGNEILGQFAKQASSMDSNDDKYLVIDSENEVDGYEIEESLDGFENFSSIYSKQEPSLKLYQQLNNKTTVSKQKNKISKS